MRVFQKKFVFKRTIDSCNLIVQWRPGHLCDYDYPISYTIEDCLEDWCTDRGYNFILFDGATRGNQIVGTFKYHGKVPRFSTTGRSVIK